MNHSENHNQTKKYVFLTGSTGILGAFFLRELLAKEQKVVTLVRPTHKKTAAERINAILALWENDSVHYLRPKIIEGDLSGEHWFEENLDWIQKNVKSVIHSAASLEFYGPRTKEPYQTNLNGLETILKLCRRAGIRKFHHISTAYVACSKKQFMESECNVG